MSEGKYNKYISYFQSVMTIGIMTCGKTLEEAEKAAKEKLKVSDLNYCHFEQTPLEHSDTEEWNPEFEIISEDPTEDKEALEWTVKIGDEMKNVIASRAGVSPDNISQEHVNVFINDALVNLIENNE